MKIKSRSVAVPYSKLPGEEVRKLASLTEKTFVVLGVPRGGTTMVAGVLQRFGIWMGGADIPINLEDPAFVRKNIKEMVAAARQRDAEHAVWGFKYPAASRFLPQLHAELRNPHYIIAWRDVLAAGTRSAREISILASITQKHRMQSANIRFARKTPAPFLFVSYERAIAHPMEFADAVGEFTGGTPPADTEELLAFMKPEGYKRAKPAE